MARPLALALICILLAQSAPAEVLWKAASTWPAGVAGPLFFVSNGVWTLKGERPPGSATLTAEGAVRVTPPSGVDEKTQCWIETPLPSALAEGFVGATVSIERFDSGRDIQLLALKAEDQLRTHLLVSYDKKARRYMFGVGAMPGGKSTAVATAPEGATQFRIVIGFKAASESRLWLVSPDAPLRDDASAVPSHNIANPARLNRFALRLHPSATWSVSNIIVAKTWEAAAGP